MLKVPAIGKYAVLSWASAHGHSQLKCQKLKVDGCTEEVLKWFNYLPARAHPRCEVSLGELNRFASSLRQCFVEASPTVEKAELCYKADQLLASLPSFHSIQSSLAVREFHSAGKECSERDHGQVCVWTWCHGTQSTSEQSQLCELSGLTFSLLRKDLAWGGICEWYMYHVSFGSVFLLLQLSFKFNSPENGEALPLLHVLLETPKDQHTLPTVTRLQ